MSKINKCLAIVTASVITIASNSLLINASNATVAEKTADVAAVVSDKASAATNVLSDSKLTGEIKAKFAVDSVVEGLDISVKTINGDVTLEGAVSNNDVIATAVKIARSVKGVKSVNSKGLIIAEGTSTISNIIPDSVITTKVKEKLLADEKVKGFEIHVDTANGKVTLTGNVTNKQLIDRAVTIAKDVKGVTEIINQLK